MESEVSFGTKIGLYAYAICVRLCIWLIQAAIGMWVFNAFLTTYGWGLPVIEYNQALMSIILLHWIFPIESRD